MVEEAVSETPPRTGTESAPESEPVFESGFESDFEPESTRSEPRRSRGVPAIRRTPSRWRARLAWAAVLVVAVGLVATILGYRGAIVETWPAAERIYTMLGMPGEPIGSGLSLVNVKFDQATDDGSKLLLVEGEIENVSGKVRLVPGLRAALFDKHEKELQFWTFDAPVPRLLPGENVKFRTRVKNPAEKAVRLTIVFYQEEEQR